MVGFRSLLKIQYYIFAYVAGNLFKQMIASGAQEYVLLA